MAEQEPDGRCWWCGNAFKIDDAEAVTNRGKPRDASGREMRRIRCPKCQAVNSADLAADRARGVAADAVNRFEMP